MAGEGPGRQGQPGQAPQAALRDRGAARPSLASSTIPGTVLDLSNQPGST